MSNTIMVLGIGNTLLSDEGVGVHTIRYLSDRYPDLEGVEWLDGGTLSFTLAGPIAAADGLIVVDAARLDATPGTVCRFEGAAMDAYLKGARGSVHEVGLADLLDMARLGGELPPRRCLVGIQPRLLDWGERPSPEVEAAIPAAAAQVMETVNRWTGGEDTSR
jgi:hydrogenase maturation protease